MTSGQTAHLCLQSIERKDNRYRTYRVTVGPDGEGGWSVTCSWGRAGNHGQSKRFHFSDETEMLRFLQSLLMKRKRNGYAVTAKGRGFPECPALDLMPTALPFDGQMDLFG